MAIDRSTLEMSSQAKVLMIDNYDSFTWNLYQYLCLLGAEVTVVRSQSCSVDELIRVHPDVTHLVISPGPGHPTTDSGISIPALRHYSGKIPILGICMGLQCIYSAFGGLVSKVGEIVHGKTSKVFHDQQGLFKGITQGILSTRYHSLAGQLGSLPAELQVTSWTHMDRNASDGETFNHQSSIIMGVRHKVYTIEAVQYHPESILSEEGKGFLSNFLNLKGGRWSDNPEFVMGDDSLTTKVACTSQDQNPTSSLPTILQKICTQRILDVEEAKRVPGGSPLDLKRKLAAHVPPSQIDFYERIRQKDTHHSQNSPTVALMAEIKRASPSKGSFVTDTTPTPPEIAISYATAGASVISVLTEPTWFKGTLIDMLQIRMAVEHLPNRPAILRKDFIIDSYQIDEARCYGADSVLLIVACLSDEKLAALFKHSKDLGMEPLVEVNNIEEFNKALQIGARVIGVNNRNLHDFNVDMQTTSNLVNELHKRTGQAVGTCSEVVMCALSGISSRSDVERYAQEGVRAILVGESLMKAQDKVAFVQELLGTVNHTKLSTTKTLVKICGIKTPEIALHAAKAGADLIGFIFVSKSRRYVSPSEANAIIHAVKQSRDPDLPTDPPSSSLSTSDWFSLQASRICSLSAQQRPLFVGVFQDSSIEEIQNIINSVPSLDLIQLHGHEPIGFSKFLTLPVIKTFHIPIDDESIKPKDFQEIFRPGYHILPLLDSKSMDRMGGTGQTFDWNVLNSILPITEHQNRQGKEKKFILAGGLNEGNILEALKKVEPLMVDVSGGVENHKGEKDQEKISRFINLVKSVV